MEFLTFGMILMVSMAVILGDGPWLDLQRHIVFGTKHRSEFWGESPKKSGCHNRFLFSNEYIHSVVCIGVSRLSFQGSESAGRFF